MFFFIPMLLLSIRIYFTSILYPQGVKSQLGEISTAPNSLAYSLSNTHTFQRRWEGTAVGLEFFPSV